jgi:hypothetical protein
MRPGPIALLLASFAACVPVTPGTDVPVTPRPEAPTVVRMAGAPVQGDDVPQVEATLTESLLGLGLVEGRLLALGARGAWLRGAARDWKPVPWGGGREELPPDGYRFSVSRAGGGAWVVAENGLYQVASGAVLRSPLSEQVEASGLRGLDSWGSGADEELWMLTAQGVTHVAGGEARPVTLRFDALGTLPRPDAVVGEGPGVALWVAGGKAFLVEVAAARASWLGEGLGMVHAWARDSDGDAWLATSTGLYVHRRAAGKLEGYTLAEAGATAAPVKNLAISGNQVLVSVEGRVARKDGEVFRTFGPGALAARGLQVDAGGRTWVLRAEGLVELQTAPPLSFEAKVKPFLAVHCDSCHAAGGGGSPQIPLTDYATAKALAPRISARLTATNTSPMPPASVETLTAEQVGLVLQWISEGMAP